MSIQTVFLITICAIICFIHEEGDTLENRIRELRNKANLTLPQLSQNLDEQYNLKISSDALSKYERGDREPKVRTWEYIADYFKVSTSFLMGLSDNQTAQKPRNPTKYGNWVKFARLLLDDSVEEFADYVNEYLELMNVDEIVTSQDISMFESNKKQPGSNVLAIIANALNMNPKSFESGYFLPERNNQALKSTLEKMGLPVNNESMMNILNALNEVPIMQFGTADIIQMYTSNLQNSDQIKDKGTLLAYLTERRDRLSEYENDDSIPEEARMDMMVESASIAEELKRQEIFESIFVNETKE